VGRSCSTGSGDVGNGRRMEARQRAMRIFSDAPWSSGRSAACHPASPDARSREPSPRMTAAGTRRISRAPRVFKIAHQVFVAAGSRALSAGIVRRLMMRMRMSTRGLLKKILMAPHCVRTIRPTRRSTPDVQPETGKRSTCFGIAAERRLNRVGVPSLDFTCNKIDDEPVFLSGGAAPSPLVRSISAPTEGSGRQNEWAGSQLGV
jgi:hypothetical protein